MKHQFQDELRIKVDHDHKLPMEDIDHLIDRVVNGAVTIIAVATVGSIIKKFL